ncbi:MAG: pyruvate, phosphate dikinase [Planctomycetota bacterium]
MTTNSPLPQPAVFSFGASAADPVPGDAAAVRSIIGGKGAGLAEMTTLGIPVPPGFTIATGACTFYNECRSDYPGPLAAEVDQAITLLEERMGQRFGDASDPLLVSVRSGAPISMPGMMDTILNVGLNRETLAGLHARASERRFGWDCYRRLIEMYGDVVSGVAHHLFQAELEAARDAAGVQQDHELGDAELEQVVAKYEQIYEQHTGKPFPQDPREQLWGAINAVFESWMGPRAVTYRRINHIPSALGTAVNVQAMVFGNLGKRSATGVAFTRDPSTGEPVFFGEFLPNAQGEDVVAGIRTPQPMRKDEISDLPSFEELFPKAYGELCEVRGNLERHYGDMQDIEFTVQDDRVYVLQTRSGKRTGIGALRIARDLVDEGIIDAPSALRQVDVATLEQVLAPTFSTTELRTAADQQLTRGLAAGPGAAAGRVALSAERAVELQAENAGAIVLVRRETSPEDIAGMEAAVGIVTARGGMTSHAAVVARGMGKPCVVGCETLQIDEGAGTLHCNGKTVREGEFISINGAGGSVFVGELKAEPSAVLRVLNGDLPETNPSYEQFQGFMSWADKHRTLKIRANADTPEDARVARLLGAEGIGLCRTEHMFFGRERILNFRRMILAPDEAGRREALGTLLPNQREDFVGIFREMDGLPVTIRLLDPPLHEFLPQTDADVEKFAKEAQLPVDAVRAKLTETHESNPMLGLRGCRLGLTHPEIYEMQMRAIVEAALESRASGVRALPEIMIPLTAIDTETNELRTLMERTAETVFAEQGVAIDHSLYLFGTMIEIPRAALTADALAQNLDFFSFGTNDLTQMTFGLSRDDTAALLVDYVEKGRLSGDPFVSLDQSGVGSLMQIAVDKARTVKPNLKVGICGEHGGDPRSVRFCHNLGFDYVSCSPYRVPVARAAAGQAGVS